MIGDDNVLSAADLDALTDALNPPVFISNLSTSLPADLAYLAVQIAADAKRRTEYNYVTCSYGISNWWSGHTTGTGDWNSTELFTAHVKGADTALGISTQSKSSSAEAEVGLWLVTGRTWPASSSVTVDFRWGGSAYLQADSEVNPLTFGASAASATYAVDIWLTSGSGDSGPRRNVFTKSVQPAFVGASASARPNVRWDDNASTPPTLTVPMGPGMEFKSKLVGMMSDSVTPGIGANASAGVDSWSQGDTYIVGSQHWTFRLPRGHTITDCGGDGVKS